MEKKVGGQSIFQPKKGKLMYPVVSMGKNQQPRGDRVGIAREQWRVWARSAFDSLARGAKAQCASQFIEH
jgi:hypothetical protein